MTGRAFTGHDQPVGGTQFSRRRKGPIPHSADIHECVQLKPGAVGSLLLESITFSSSTSQREKRVESVQ